MWRVTLKQKGEYKLSQLNSHPFFDAVPLRLEHIFQNGASIKQSIIVFRVVQKVNTVYPRIGHLLKVFQSLFNILSLRVFNVSSRSVQHIHGLVDLGQYSPWLFVCLSAWVIHGSINQKCVSAVIIRFLYVIVHAFSSRHGEFKPQRWSRGS